ncbi:hypothetical protein ACYTX7_09425, partial [Streptococcus pyogenes]
MFEMTVLIVHGSRSRSTFVEWLQKLPEWNPKEDSERIFHAVISPQCCDLPAVDQEIGQLPVDDRATIAWADEI